MTRINQTLLADVVCVNRYYGWYTQPGQLDEGAQVLAGELNALHRAFGKPISITEFGTDTLPGAHKTPPEMWTEAYQVEFLRRYLDVAAERPFVAGMHVWNFADFKTGQGTMRATGMNFKGVFTRDRRPKMAAHFLRTRWARPWSRGRLLWPLGRVAGTGSRSGRLLYRWRRRRGDQVSAQGRFDDGVARMTSDVLPSGPNRPLRGAERVGGFARGDCLPKREAV
jgi:glycosyl hydrolase family 2